MIQNAGERLLRIIDDILDIAKIESNQLKIIKKLFGINVALNEAIENHRVTLLKLAKLNIKFVFNPPDFNQEYYINTDKQRFMQIFDNLLSNAIKFTDIGEIEVGYSLFEKDKKDFVQFYVKDSGIGMKPEDMEIIFERFM